MRKAALIASCVAILALAAGCQRQQSTNGTTGPGAPTTTAAAKKKLYWVQAVKGHPVHQLTQIAFREACKRLGYECEVLGTDGPDVAGTIAMAEQALARGDGAGMAIWTGDPSYNPFIEKAGKAGLPIILPHFPVPEGSVPGAKGCVSCDPAAYAKESAEFIGQAIGGKGTVAVTQGSFNSTENMVAETFKKTMAEKYPGVKVLDSELEGFDPGQAIPKAVSVMRAHPDLTAALSTTGGGPTTWAQAQKETGRKIVAVGMDYTRVNLDLVKSGEIRAVIGQPLWDEAQQAAELLVKASKGDKIEWWTKLPAPLITKDGLTPYYELLDKVEKAINK